MSFDQLSSTEAQRTTMRRHEDPEYQDDPEFSRFAEDLSRKLFTLTSNINRLSQQISLLGTKRDTERVRERVHDLLEEARDGFKDVGDGIKRLTAWEDLNVRSCSILPFCDLATITCLFELGNLLIHGNLSRHHKSTLNKSFRESFRHPAPSFKGFRG